MYCFADHSRRFFLFTAPVPHPSALAVAITIAAEVPKAVPPPPDEFVVVERLPATRYRGFHGHFHIKYTPPGK